jgi:hypothetical protein
MIGRRMREDGMESKHEKKGEKRRGENLERMVKIDTSAG